MICTSAAGGLVTIACVWARRFGPARVSAALAVAAIVGGWAVAQHPRLLPGLTIEQAAAGRSTLIAVVIAAAGGAIILVPSLLLLFSLFLHGRLDAHADGASVADVTGLEYRNRARLLGGSALACFVVGAGLTVVGDSGWARVVGVTCLFAFAASAFVVSATIPNERR